MKNKESTTAKYYVQIWSQREAKRLSMKCFNQFSLDRLDDVMANAKVPTSAETTKWLKNQQMQIEKDFGNQLDDQALLNLIEGDFEIF